MRNITKLLISAMMIISGTLTANAALDLGNVTGGSFKFSSLVTTSGLFNETGSFSLDASSVGSFGSTSIAFDVSGFTIQNITDFNFSIYEVGSATAVYDSGVINTIVSQQPIVLDLAGIDKSYTIDFSGTTIGDGSYSLTVTPVPEASTIALMLSGIGVAGFMARRRRMS